MKYMTMASEAGSLPLLVCCTENHIELNGNDLTSGIPYKGKSIYVDVKHGEPYFADILLAAPSLIPVISPKLASVLRERSFLYGEMIPIINDFYNGFFVLNLIPRIELLDENKSMAIFVNGNKIYYRAHLNKYSGQEGIFRIKNFATFPFVTDGVIQMFSQFDHKGINFSDEMVTHD